MSGNYGVRKCESATVLEEGGTHATGGVLVDDFITTVYHSNVYSQMDDLGEVRSDSDIDDQCMLLPTPSLSDLIDKDRKLDTNLPIYPIREMYCDCGVDATTSSTSGESSLNSAGCTSSANHPEAGIEIRITEAIDSDDNRTADQLPIIYEDTLSDLETEVINERNRRKYQEKECLPSTSGLSRIDHQYDLPPRQHTMIESHVPEDGEHHTPNKVIINEGEQTKVHEESDEDDSSFEVIDEIIADAIRSSCMMGESSMAPQIYTLPESESEESLAPTCSALRDVLEEVFVALKPYLVAGMAQSPRSPGTNPATSNITIADESLDSIDVNGNLSSQMKSSIIERTENLISPEDCMLNKSVEVCDITYEDSKECTPVDGSPMEDVLLLTGVNAFKFQDPITYIQEKCGLLLQLHREDIEKARLNGMKKAATALTHQLAKYSELIKMHRIERKTLARYIIEKHSEWSLIRERLAREVATLRKDTTRLVADRVSAMDERNNSGHQSRSTKSGPYNKRLLETLLTAKNNFDKALILDITKQSKINELKLLAFRQQEYIIDLQERLMEVGNASGDCPSEYCNSPMDKLPMFNDKPKADAYSVSSDTNSGSVPTSAESSTTVQSRGTDDGTSTPTPTSPAPSLLLQESEHILLNSILHETMLNLRPCDLARLDQIIYCDDSDYLARRLLNPDIASMHVYKFGSSHSSAEPTMLNKRPQSPERYIWSAESGGESSSSSSSEDDEEYIESFINIPECANDL